MEEFSLQFDVSEIGALAAKYAYPAGDERPRQIGDLARVNGYLNRDQFLEVAKWKSHRPAHLHAMNNEESVLTWTRTAFLCEGDLQPIRALTKLKGVRIPTASAILHFCHPGRYPLIDFRALESLGVPRRTSVTMRLWCAYAEFCRGLADAQHVSLRELDRALWAWSDKKSGRQSRCRG